MWDQLLEILQSSSTWSGDASVWVRIWDHLWVSIVATAIAGMLVGPVALWLAHTRRGADLASAVVNVGRAVPSFGILAIAVLVLVNVGAGIGTPWPVMAALIALAAPPIFTHTIAGIQGVPAATVEAARGMGFSELGVLRSVEIPMALPILMEGVRIALVQGIATATLGALSGWGGLGRYIIDGFQQQDRGELVFGAFLVALMAVTAETVFGILQRRFTPPGILPAT